MNVRIKTDSSPRRMTLVLIWGISDKAWNISLRCKLYHMPRENGRYFQPSPRKHKMGTLKYFLNTDRCLENCNQYEDEYAEPEFFFAMIKVF